MTDHVPGPNVPASHPTTEPLYGATADAVRDQLRKPTSASLGDPRDLRNLLEAVVDVLTLPFDTPDYEQQLAERAGWVRTAVRVALDENPADIGWDADYLRSKAGRGGRR